MGYILSTKSHSNFSAFGSWHILLTGNRLFPLNCNEGKWLGASQDSSIQPYGLFATLPFCKQLDSFNHALQ
uniref:Uncharacterized protein n=1 Tax=Anguilla anguilla TaxID=7936 RepID=A0A0E9QX19_ANGAN